MHTEVYTGSLLTKNYIHSSEKPLGNPLSNQPYITYNTTKEVTLIPSRHTLPLVQHNTTKNADLDPLKNTQHFSAIHTEFLSKVQRITLVTEQIWNQYKIKILSHTLWSMQSLSNSQLFKILKSVQNSNLFFCI